MTENIQSGDFIEMDYTAKLTDNGLVFDTTVEDVAKKNNIYNKEVKYKPLVIKVGAGHVVKGLDAFIVDKAPGNYSVSLSADDAFGKKNAKLLRLVSIKEFHKNQIQPVPGLEVDLDGRRGIVRTVNGGRVIVDFNHPLSSQGITYDFFIKFKVTDPKVKVEAALELFKIPFEKVESADGKIVVTFQTKIPDEIVAVLLGEVQKLTDVKDIEFK